MSCIFCQRHSRLTQEHIFPDGMADLIPGSGTQHRLIVRAGVQPCNNHFPSEASNLTVGTVCGDCNSGWMSDLEKRNKPFLTALINASPESVDRTARGDLAAWCVKTALVGGSSISDSLNSQLFHDFFQSQTPSPHSRVWLMYADIPGVQYFDFRDFSIVTNPCHRPAIHDGYMAVIAIGHFGALVLSQLSGDPPVGAIESQFGSGLAQIWPNQEPPEWPPPGGYFDLSALEMLSECLRTNSDVTADRPTFLRE